MLLSQNLFFNLDNHIHLATGGESPALKSHQDAVARFFQDKSQGEPSRVLIEATYRRAQQKIARLLGAAADDIAFLSSASDGVNLLAYALEWRPGDNVVVADVEFPSDVLPWTRLAERGVEVRIVRNKNWHVSLEDIDALIDERTRVVVCSHVSYFTGQRLPLAELSALVRAQGPLFLVDATHAAGVVQVDASLADILVCSCYKWLLGVHGSAVFYWNRERVPQLEPPFVGWATPPELPSWDNPLAYSLPPTADRFVPGNPSYIGLYVLENALDHLLSIGPAKIEPYILGLSGRLWEGVAAQGWEMMTPSASQSRAGNVCFMTPNVDELVRGMAENNILIWGAYGGVKRVRVSTHLFNTAEEVDRFLTVLKR
ncbi:MAG: aminotransferase class V-fold PLP-dependent enzyme [Ardenticatenaceae bacterium]|nr:aminotransferase class V-fold PLP-dependent enzyme [Ardenticatenaceae bacterium]